jgi:hypothetical protein
LFLTENASSSEMSMGGLVQKSPHTTRRASLHCATHDSLGMHVAPGAVGIEKDL